MTLKPPPSAPWMFAVILFAFGAPLLIGGIDLLWLGGSSYYILAGAALVLASALLWRGKRLGMWVYVALLVYTLLWSFWEIGLDGWALASRMGAPLLLGAYFLFPHVRRGLA
jgi:quinoprotein glucose dehydrogenase